MKHNNRTTGFTLIELLVTVALLGILAGGILIALNIRGTIDKANITKTKQFAASLENSLVISQVGKWSFEEVDASNNTPDTSGYRNDGALSDVSIWKPPTDPACKELGLGGCVSFNGTNYIMVSDDNATITTILEGMKNLTIQAWFKVTLINNNTAIVAKLWTGDGSYSLRTGTEIPTYSPCPSVPSDKIQFDTQTSSRVCSVSTTSINDGKWHHIIGTYDGNENKQRLYIDGVLEDTDNQSGIISNSDEEVCIGRFCHNDSGQGSGFVGTIDEVSIYDQPLTLSQIQHLYAQGVIRRAVAYK